MTITDTNTARAILTTAKENDVWEAVIPSDKDELLKQATFVYEQANAAWNNNIRGPAVTAVKFSAEVDGAHTGKDVEPENDEVTAVLSQTISEIKRDVDLLVEKDLDAVQALLDAELAGKARKGVINYIELQLKDAFKEPDENTSELESGDRGQDYGVTAVLVGREAQKPKIAYPTRPDNIDTGGWTPKKSKFDEKFEAEEFARTQAKKLNLPVPGRVDDIPNPAIDHGVASLSINDLAEKLNDASLCLAAATWQTAIAEIDVEHTKRVGNHYYNKEFPKAQENAKNKDAAVAVVEEVPQVKQWRDKQFEAESRYTTYRSLKEIYAGTHGTISRIFAMRQEERERG